MRFVTVLLVVAIVDFTGTYAKIHGIYRYDVTVFFAVVAVICMLMDITEFLLNITRKDGDKNV